MIYHAMDEDEIVIVDRQKIDRTYIEMLNNNLNEFENWLHSGAISPAAAQNVLNKFYEQMPF